MATNLPFSEQSSSLDNIAVTRGEFREQIGVLLEYLAQALGDVVGTYTTEVVNPLEVKLQGTPTLEVAADPDPDDSTLRLPSTDWVKKTGRYVGATAPLIPADGMLWVDNTPPGPYTLKVFNEGNNDYDVLSGFEPGTRCLFQQTNAPLGWTKSTALDNYALRVVSGDVTTGGVLDFTEAFSVRATTGIVEDRLLTICPRHSHGMSLSGSHIHGPYQAARFSAPNAVDEQSGGGATELFWGDVTVPSTGSNHVHSINAAGNNSPHDHPYSGGDIDISVQYVDFIIAEKD